MEPKTVSRLSIAFLIVGALLSIPASAQLLFGSFDDAPQHGIYAGGAADGNKNFNGTLGWLEKEAGATYLFSSIDIVPVVIKGQPVSFRATTNVGQEQVLAQKGRWTLAVAAQGGAALPTQATPSLNFVLNERATGAFRINQVLRPGGNHYVVITPGFTQILGQGGNGQTWRLAAGYMLAF